MAGQHLSQEWCGKPQGPETGTCLKVPQNVRSLCKGRSGSGGPSPPNRTAQAAVPPAVQPFDVQHPPEVQARAKQASSTHLPGATEFPVWKHLAPKASAQGRVGAELVPSDYSETSDYCNETKSPRGQAEWRGEVQRESGYLCINRVDDIHFLRGCSEKIHIWKLLRGLVVGLLCFSVCSAGD